MLKSSGQGQVTGGTNARVCILFAILLFYSLL